MKHGVVHLAARELHRRDPAPHLADHLATLLCDVGARLGLKGRGVVGVAGAGLRPFRGGGGGGVIDFVDCPVSDPVLLAGLASPYWGDWPRATQAARRRKRRRRWCSGCLRRPGRCLPSALTIASVRGVPNHQIERCRAILQQTGAAPSRTSFGWFSRTRDTFRDKGPPPIAQYMSLPRGPDRCNPTSGRAEGIEPAAAAPPDFHLISTAWERFLGSKGFG